MHGEELVLGGNPALAQAFVDEHNQRVAELREAQRRQEINRINQVANMVGGAILGKRRPGFVQD